MQCRKPANKQTTLLCFIHIFNCVIALHFSSQANFFFLCVLKCYSHFLDKPINNCCMVYFKTINALVCWRSNCIFLYDWIYWILIYTYTLHKSYCNRTQQTRAMQTATTRMMGGCEHSIVTTIPFALSSFVSS